MSFDNLYNNFKIVEQEVKGTTTSSSSSSSQNMAFVSSPSITNEVNTAYGKTSRKITINESDTAGYYKSKIECFNCHKLGHFARECRQSKNQDSRNRNQDSSRRIVNVEETAFIAMVAIDGVGFDWSYMADDKVPTNMSLMAFLDSEGNSQLELQEKGAIDSGCSRNKTGNVSYLFEFEEIDGGYVAFGGDPKGGKITGKGGSTTFRYRRVTGDRPQETGTIHRGTKTVEDPTDSGGRISKTAGPAKGPAQPDALEEAVSSS
uniref:Ribonuclease H-like domain-containing protein n=1 Tax=Tanacetum cinerariifolium TaxID=118510 RepID=A0A699HJG8_TANCI|nr:ribonuclease H-like domain-containing protein [Tanacetum cinerariifolium]